MLFRVILGNPEGNIFFVDQPWWMKFKISFAVIFIKKTQESFLKTEIEPWYKQVKKY